jgi:large subunit ribosomal protein L3
MPGRMGGNLVTKKNVIVIDIRPEDNLMLVKGSVPGAKQSLLQIFFK